MNKETIIAIVSILLIGIVAGSAGTIWYYKPKIAEWRAEQIRMEMFSECVEDKIMGVGGYAELMLIDVLTCVKIIINEE